MTHAQAALPVTASERVSDVLARDETLVEVFARHAPHFAKLRNSALRRVMARLVTVEQAARTARIPVEPLLCALNKALGIDTTDVATASRSEKASIQTTQTHPEQFSVVELDVREDLRVGREPFSKIMGAVGGLGEREVLRLRAIFEPVPLFAVLEKRGLVYESVCDGPDDWSVWFWRPEKPTAPAPIAAPDATAPISVVPTDDESAIWLDVRGASPPAPMLRTLTALETLPRDRVLVQVNSRVPEFLFPVLAERGFAWQVDDSRIDRVLVRIWHARS